MPMHEEDQARVRAGLRAAIRDRLYALAEQHPHWDHADLDQQIRQLREDADHAGFAIVAGLAQALEENLRVLHPEECLPVFLTYLTRSLALEPCGREAGAVLTLLLAGVHRRLAEARLPQVA
ncbi:hypothetical protein [Pedomonas mirosovicensis]|uniref:hypothetical protein n=1 Tax=Pedomonas mirosovicensis TaxID=2908641 RepID=UPI002167579E|nr:hypothetical protein [Pedomonas mirosovicensis]MCH8685624.1 hypothetical protein [Pedomonas mirosovicensis]